MVAYLMLFTALFVAVCLHNGYSVFFSLDFCIAMYANAFFHDLASSY